MSDDYYRVKMATGIDVEGCAHCGAGKQWSIVYVEHGATEETEIGQSFGDRELADDICDLMNMAYEAGLELTMNLDQQKRLAAHLIQHVNEIPDRTSPEDQPEMMLVTADELENALLCAFEIYDAETPDFASDTEGKSP